MAFISSKAINNRKLFIDQLRTAIDAADFQSISFLKSLHSLVTGLHSPCLRLELLQYILNLDNRSVKKLYLGMASLVIQSYFMLIYFYCARFSIAHIG